MVIQKRSSMKKHTANSTQAHNLLKEQNKLFESILNRIALPTFVLDNNHKIIFWNRAIEQLTGFSSEEMLGTNKQWLAFYANERPTLADLIISQGDNSLLHYYKTGRYSALIDDAYEAEGFFPDISPQGEWLSFTAASIKDDDGNITGAIETLVNISEAKRNQQALEESEERYKQLSITDVLTGLYNKRLFTEQLTNELDRCRRYGMHASLCLIDLDNFKSMNDTYGHLFGDQILAEFGSIAKSNLRYSDSAYRYGGEEFAIILPNTDLPGAQRLAERVRKHLSSHIFHPTSDEKIHITASLGVTSISPSDQTINNIIKRADIALYKAKQGGKNRTETTIDSFITRKSS